MPSLPSTSQWFDHIHYSKLTFALSGSVEVLPVVFGGGAEKGEFLYIDSLRKNEIVYDVTTQEDLDIPSTSSFSELHLDEIILEIQQKPIGGFTHYDACQWLVQCSKGGSSVQFKLVKPGYLMKNLRDYLSLRFAKDSLDYELQNTVRDNVYLRTVPCTTRAPRPGERDGLDYKFVSVEEFMQLDASGDLLESGIYEGNYYGTPKPPLVPPKKSSSAHHLLSTSASTNSSSSQHSSGRIGKKMPPLFPPEAYSATSPQPPVNGGGSGAGQPPRNGTGWPEDGMGPLPPGWEMSCTDQGEKYFIDHNNGNTHWDDPRLAREPRPSVSDSVTSEQSDLPYGWERIDDVTYGTYFVDHIHKVTQFHRPAVAAAHTSGSHPSGSSSNPTARAQLSTATLPPKPARKRTGLPPPHLPSRDQLPSVRRLNSNSSVGGGHDAAVFTSLPPRSTNDLAAQQQRQQNLCDYHRQRALSSGTVNIDSPPESSATPVAQWLAASRPTSVPPPPAYKMVRSPAGRKAAGSLFGTPSRRSSTRSLKMGDQIFLFPGENPHRGLFTRDPAELQGELVSARVMKGPRGLGFTLVGNDGSNTELEEFLQIKSILVGGPAHRDARLRTGDILVYVNDSCVLGFTQQQMINLLQSIPMGQMVSLQVCRGYPLLFDPNDPQQSIVLQDTCSSTDDGSSLDRSTLNAPRGATTDLFPSHLQAQRMTMRIVKGGQGFGFTIADGAFGQKVKNIIDQNRCRNLREGDILVRINENDVTKMQHADIVEALRDCPVGREAVIEILRTGGGVPPPQATVAAAPYFMLNSRRSKTPTSEMVGKVPPPVKPRSRTPGPSFPPRPAGPKPNGSLPSNHNGYAQNPPYYEGNYVDHSAIYENFSQLRMGAGGRDRSQSPGRGQPGSLQRGRTTAPSNRYAAQTPNFVPSTVYAASRKHPATFDQLSDAYNSSPASQSSVMYQEMGVNLIRGSNGFGFRVLGGAEEGSQVKVGHIIPGGSAALDGRLLPQDEIVEIDSTPLLSAPHSLALDCMSRAAERGHVKLIVRRRVPTDTLMSRSVSMPISNHQLQQHQQHSDVVDYPYDVTVVRRDDEGFGFVIISSVNKSGSSIALDYFMDPDSNFPIIGRIIEDSPADRCEILRVGDRIVAVNGINILNMHHGDIVNLIKDSGNVVRLTVDFPDEHIPSAQGMAAPFEHSTTYSSGSDTNTMSIEFADGESQNTFTGDVGGSRGGSGGPHPLLRQHSLPSTTNVPPAQQLFRYSQPPHRQPPVSSISCSFVTVQLQRGAKGYGFSIRGGQEFQNMPLFVLRIADGGPASVDGRLQVGDQLISINDVTCENMKHSEAIEIIKNEPAVQLVVRRDHSHGAIIPPPIPIQPGVGMAPLATGN